MKRRKAIKNMGLGIGALSISKITSYSSNEDYKNNPKLKGNINHSVCRWCYDDIPLDTLASTSKKLGLKAIDLLKPSEWKIVKKHGLICSLATDDFISIKEGFNNPENHKFLQENYQKLLPQAAENGIKQVIVFSGNRNNINDAEGIENCAIGLKPLVNLAEELGITLVMELLNSKVDHTDYQCDNTEWGVSLAKKIDSENFKLLYDIYHMQIMEGNVIATIKKYHKYISHYHTGGVPGRNEINDTQELNYPAIIKAIKNTGYTGYLAQEFIPTYPDKIKALKESILICDI